jgi:hypothetical protein
MAIDGINLKPLLLGDTPSAAISISTDAASATAHRALAGKGVDWTSLATDIGGKIEEMFDIPLVGLMISAWNDFRELKDCADPDKHPPNERISLSLVDHDLEASFEPHLDIAISGLPAVRIDFEITAEIELAGIELTIENAVIRSLRIGSCQAAAKVKCEGAVILERSSRRLELPGELHLPHGISIGPSSTNRPQSKPRS